MSTNTNPSSSRSTGKGKEVLRTTTTTPAHITMPGRLFDAKSLAGSAYESCDSDDSCSSDGKTPTMSNILRPPPVGGGRSGTPEQPPRCPSRPRGIILEKWVMSHAPDKDVLDILDKRVKIGARTMSIFEAAQPGLGTSAREQPSHDLAVALHNTLRDSKLSVKQKRSFFASLNWKFECFACEKIKNPDAFGTSFHLWGPKKNGPKPRLRSGPCTECVEKMRGCDDPDGILAIDVHLPPECANRV